MRRRTTRAKEGGEKGGEEQGQGQEQEGGRGMNDLERAFVEFERADAAEADVAALRAEEQAVLASAECKTMVELAAKL